MVDSKPQGLETAPEADSQGRSEPQFMTIDEFRTEINKINTAYKKQMVASVQKMMDEFKAEFKSSLSQPIDKPEKAESNSEVAKLKEQLAILLKRDEENAARLRDTQLRTSLSDALTKVGVNPAALRHATGFLVDAEKKVRFNDDGELVFNFDNIDYPLEQGIKVWAKSDDAKFYLAPKNPVGSAQAGAVSAGPTKNLNSKPSEEELGAAILGLTKSLF